MRSLLTVCLLFLSFNATAESDYSVVWNITEWDSEGSPDRISLDLNQGTKFVTANGIVEFFNDNTTFATSGTCFLTNENSIFCNLVVGFFSMEIEIDLEDLGGIAYLIDYDGFPLDAGLMEVASVE